MNSHRIIVTVIGKDRVGIIASVSAVEFGGLLGRAPVMAVHRGSSRDFIRRGGRIPAPLQALNN